MRIHLSIRNNYKYKNKIYHKALFGARDDDKQSLKIILALHIIYSNLLYVQY